MAGKPARLEKLKAAMNAESKDPVELARLLQVLSDSLSDKKPAFSADEKELLTAAGLVVKELLMLREHIFYNYQSELVSLYAKQPCPQLPPTYNHLMSDIKQHIDKLASQ